MNDATPKDGDIREIDGIMRRYTSGHWIRYYDPPQKEGDDMLIAVMRMVGNFERRFLKTVEGGQEVGTDADSIDRLRKKFYEAGEVARLTEKYSDKHHGLIGTLADALEALLDKLSYKKHSRARKALELIKNNNSYGCQIAKVEEETWGGMLAVSVFRRMISNITEHISCRIGKAETGGPDVEVLDKLQKSIDDDLKEVWNLFKYVRRAGGEEDKDQVLMEMMGEPMKLLSVTQVENPVAKLTIFFNNRYHKISQCWNDIDRATEAITTLIASSSRLEHSDILQEIKEFSAAAKERCEIQRHDPDFEDAAADLRSGRNLIRAFRPNNKDSGYVATVTPRMDTDILKLVQDYRKLVYDIAHVRTPRHVSTDALIQRIDHKLHHIYKDTTIVP